MDSDKQHITLFIIIAERKKKNELHKLLMENSARVMHSIYAKGSVRINSFIDLLGFIPEENKIILTSLMSSEKANVLIEILNKEYNFAKPNTGIAFTIPIERLSY